MTKPKRPADSIRPGRRRQMLAPVSIVLGVLFTLTTAAAQIIPSGRPSSKELLREELGTIVDQRRDRIAELQATGDRCHPPTAHELARLLVMDGQFSIARSFADDYERRCGEDPVVRHWGDAPIPRPRR